MPDDVALDRAHAQWLEAAKQLEKFDKDLVDKVSALNKTWSQSEAQEAFTRWISKFVEEVDECKTAIVTRADSLTSLIRSRFGKDSPDRGQCRTFRRWRSRLGDGANFSKSPTSAGSGSIAPTTQPWYFLLQSLRAAWWTSSVRPSDGHRAREFVIRQSRGASPQLPTALQGIGMTCPRRRVKTRPSESMRTLALAVGRRMAQIPNGMHARPATAHEDESRRRTCCDGSYPFRVGLNAGDCSD